MNPPSQSSSSPPLPNLSAPNKTLVSKKPTRRSSTLSTATSSSPIQPLSRSPTSPLARTPSSDLSESLASLAGLSSTQHLATTTSTIKQTFASTTSSLLRKHPEPYSNFFTTAQTTALKTFCSSTPLDLLDTTFWPGLLANTKFPSTHTPQGAYDLEMATVGLSIELTANNVRTRNFNKLVLHLLSQLHLIREGKPGSIPTPAYNALFLTRVFSKHFAGNLTNEEIMQQFEGDVAFPSGQANNHVALDTKKLTIHPSVESDPRPKAEQLLDALLFILIDTDPNTNYSTYEFYVEALNTVIVLLSTQLHRTKVADKNPFLDILLHRFQSQAGKLVGKLLQNFIEQKAPPPQSSNVVYNAYSYFFSSRSGSASDADTLPVADRSLLLLLLLATQSKRSHDNASAYRQAFSSLRDCYDPLLLSDADTKSQEVHYISFKDLFELFSRCLGVEEKMLLFYLMLVENEHFRVYVLSRTDPETIYIPIMKIIYEAIEGKTNYSQVYILFIIMLILSQDEVNNETIQKITVSNLAWFTERPLLKSISLGGLVVLVLIRTLQFNLSHQKDIYFHTNCLAILANMSNTMLDMHPYVAQRIISLYELIARRQQKIASKIQASGESTAPQDFAVYEDMLSLVLEIINSILNHRLKYNTQLVYALLLKRDSFVPLRNHPRLAELITNIESVIEHFHARVSEANLKAPSTNEILELVEQAARTWTPPKQEGFPDLKFQYEEEQDSREFFVPYIWALVHRRTFIYWSEEKAHILQEYRLMSGETEDQETVHEAVNQNA